MKYRFRVSKRRLPPSCSQKKLSRFVLRGHDTLRRRQEQDEKISFFSLFDHDALASTPKKSKKKRRVLHLKTKLFSFLRRTPRAIRAYFSEIFTDISKIRRAWRARSELRQARKSIQLTPILAGFLCATLVVSLFSAAGVLIGLFAPYARSYVGITIPSFVGQNAEEILEHQLNPHLNLIVQYESNPEVAPGEVITQLPRAGVIRRIYEKDGFCNVTLTVSRPQSPYILENLAGKDERDALLSLRNQSLSISVLKVESTTVPAGRVIKTDPDAGSALKEGERVTVHVSRGKQDARFSIPNLIGMSETDAAFHLQAAGFSIDQITYVASNADLGSVLSQSPAAYTHAAYGSAISLVVSIGTHAEQMAIPDVFGLSLKEAAELLAQYSLTVESVHTVKSPSAQGTVLRQIPPQGTAITATNRHISLYVSS